MVKMMNCRVYDSNLQMNCIIIIVIIHDFHCNASLEQNFRAAEQEILF